MCGICGIIGSDNQKNSAPRLQRMMDAMTHRGPDGEGVFVAPRAAIGMRRLSIIDLPGGNQPIWNEAETLAVVFNGEIYNYRDLRASLESKGHIFRTQSDTEVIIHAYETWGEDCVRELRGMFAFAILEMLDGKAGRPRRIFLARDRLGIKPLYYASAGGNFYFASEVRALLAGDCVPRQLSPAAVSSYLLFGSIGEPMTLLEGVDSLPPGYRGYVSCDSPANSFRPNCYWSLADIPQESKERAHAESPAACVRTCFEDAVRRHLIADVPVGVFLSSGMDSTAIAAVASRQHPGIKTFTVVFPEQDFNEGQIARHSAEQLGTEHAEFILSGEEMKSRLDEAVMAFDQPSADGVNTFFVSWAARQAGLKVALSGLGSDELFGGYSTFRSTAQIARLIASSRWIPAAIRRGGAAPLNAWAARSRRPDVIRKMTAAFTSPQGFPHPYFFTRTLFSSDALAELLPKNDDGADAAPWMDWLSNAAREAGKLDAFNAVSWLETRSYLVNMLLRDTDTMSMRHSLEVRVPFLDTRLVELVLALPGATKQMKGMRKVLLAEALGDLLPREIIEQPKKTFTLPWEGWLRGELRQRVATGLSDCDAKLAAVVNAAAVRNVWQDFLAGRTSWSRPWSLFVLNEWVRRNLSADGGPSARRETKSATAVF
ncbi:MAG TPA: asparagine synthase (glutamine-hydrolyzing) [Candidatus Acidoferrales bacterium]|nr:asparagine synthase (glutamine-hydrolyzing) [Candidatus Acidoferrales bacterium]